MGHEKEAHEAALELLKIDPEFSLKKFAKTVSSKNQDRLKRYIEALRKAGIGYHEVVAGHTTAGELRALVEKLVPVG